MEYVERKIKEEYDMELSAVINLDEQEELIPLSITQGFSGLVTLVCC